MDGQSSRESYGNCPNHAAFKRNERRREPGAGLVSACPCPPASPGRHRGRDPRPGLLFFPDLSKRPWTSTVDFLFNKCIYSVSIYQTPAGSPALEQTRRIWSCGLGLCARGNVGAETARNYNALFQALRRRLIVSCVFSLSPQQGCVSRGCDG